jgi:hypothetical protein
VLRGLDAGAQRLDLATCATALHEHLHPQRWWPFSYPYGEYDEVTIDILRELEFHCGFTVWTGTNPRHYDHFQLRRVDTNDIRCSEQPLACAH